MAPSNIANANLAAYPGWSVMYSTSLSGTVSKRYMHHGTKIIAKSVPEIERVIQLCGHSFQHAIKMARHMHCDTANRGS